MSLYPTEPSTALKARAAVKRVVDMLHKEVETLWPEVYQNKITVVPGSELLDPQNNDEPFDPPLYGPDGTVTSVDVEAAQAFYDELGANSLPLIVALGLLGSGGNLLDLMNRRLAGDSVPDEVLTTGLQAFEAALIFRDAAIAAGLDLRIKTLPPVDLTPDMQSWHVAVTAKNT